MILYDNEEIYGESIEFYDIASSLPSGTYVYLLEKFAKACSKKAGIVLDIGAGTGRNAIELAKRMPDKEIVEVYEDCLYGKVGGIPGYAKPSHSAAVICRSI